MVDEMVALHSNGTWDLVSLPSSKSIVGCRWVYTVKVGPDGQVDRLKVYLVAKGYTQIMVVTMVTPSLLLPRLLMFAYFSPWQLCVIDLFINWILRMFSFLVNFSRKCIWSNHLVLLPKRSLV